MEKKNEIKLTFESLSITGTLTAELGKQVVNPLDELDCVLEQEIFSVTLVVNLITKI
jgi:hypothetical protein